MARNRPAPAMMKGGRGEGCLSILFSQKVDGPSYVLRRFQDLRVFVLFSSHQDILFHAFESAHGV